MHHQEMVDDVMRLSGLTELIKRFWPFRWSYTVQDHLQHKFPDLSILKAPLVPDDVLEVIVSIIPEQKLLPCLPRTSLSLCSYRTMFGPSDQLQYTEALQDDTKDFSSHIALRLQDSLYN